MILNAQKWFIFGLSLIFLSCNPADNRNTESSSTIITANKNNDAIDSLLSRISNDSIALFNYLSLAQSNREHYAELKTYQQLGSYYAEHCEFSKAITYHTGYLETAKKTGNQAEEVEALNTLAHNYMKICAFDKSSQYFFKALSLSGELSECDTQKGELGKAKALNGLGNIYLKMNQPDEAIPYLRQSLQLKSQHNHTLGIAKNMADIGTYFKTKAEYDSAHYYLDRSLHLYLKSNWASGINLCHGRIGNIYMMEGNYRSASEYIENAYKSLLHTSDKLNWLNTCYSLGNIYIKEGRYEDAETLLLEGMQVSEELKLPNYQEKASVLLSELYKQQSNFSAALEAYTLSVSYAKAFRSEQNISRIMKHRLEYEEKSNETEKALQRAQVENIEGKRANAIYIILLFFATLSGFIIRRIKQYALTRDTMEQSLCQEKIKSGFYFNISQEFQTPVTIITGLVERIKSNLDAKSLLKSTTELDIDILSHQSQHLLSLITGISSTTTVCGNVTSYLSCLFESFSQLAQNKKVDYAFLDNAKELNIEYQPEKLRLIFSNLLTHIIQQSREKEAISVTMEHDKEKKLYLVSISKSNTPKSYFPEMWNKSEEAMEKNVLPYIKPLVKELSGSIEIEKKSREETIFSISFPTFLTEENSHKESLSMQIQEEELSAAISQLFDVKSKYALGTICAGEASAEFIRQITDLIHKEVGNTENIIESIAGKACLSTSQLNRKIKAATGMTTSNYILKIRLNKAAQQLSRLQKPIGEIALNCGFNDFAYFSRAFKKEFGMTPTSFQRLPHSVN